MVDLGAYKDKFGESGQRILEHAMTESRKRDQNYVSVEHILEALIKEEPDMFNSTMRELSLDPVVVRMAIEKRLDTSRQHIPARVSDRPGHHGLIQTRHGPGALAWTDDQRVSRHLKPHTRRQPFL
jgi:ATP-dependent Clp protease ATP-binding subunit ClpA